MPPTMLELDDVNDLRRRLGALEQIWPADLSLTEARRADADAALDGEVAFNHHGQQHVRVGRAEIDWAGGHIHHQEWRAQLNRFFHLQPLAAAFLATGDRRYAEAARDYILDWIRAHPVPTDGGAWALAAYDNALNLAIRIGNSRFFGWLEALAFFVEQPTSAAVFDNETLRTILESVRAQLNHLLGRLTALGNMRVAEADTLIAASARLQPLGDAVEWGRVGRATLDECVLRQVLPDGAHVERVPDYHNWMTTVFHRHWQLGRARPELTATIPTATVAAMFDYAVTTQRPNGAAGALHDDHGPNGASRHGDMHEQRDAFRAEAHLPPTKPAASHHFADAGQIILRDGWERSATYITFDATPWVGSHSHLSRNAIQLDHAGRPLLVDPGKLSYEVTDPLMAHGKSTRAHNTINLNGWNQAPTNPTGTRHWHEPGCDLVASVYEGGFWPGQYHWGFTDGLEGGVWARHHRFVLWVHDRCLVVVDAVQRAAAPGAASPVLEANWQFAFGPVQLDPQHGSALVHDEAGGLWMRCIGRPDETAMTVYQGEVDPPRGWVGGSERLADAPQLCLTAPMTGDYAELVTLLVPYTGAAPPEVEASLSRPEPNLTAQLDLRWADGRHDQTRWATRLIAPLAGADRDAVLVHESWDARGACLDRLRCT